jgi:RNA polymerase sigma-70 factor (ECF subfamily)
MPAAAGKAGGMMDEFEAFYRRHMRLVYAVALARGGSAVEAEDLTQETFLRAWRNGGVLASLERGAQRAWLVRTARNLSVDVWRRRQLEEAAPPPKGASPEEEARSGLRVDVERALAALGEGDRELVVLRYVEEMNSREIGEALGVPEGTVRRRLAGCREVLARELAQYAPGGGER